jgi:uncharacterized protein YneF (UPF0154 family)
MSTIDALLVLAAISIGWVGGTFLAVKALDWWERR